jgi:hypothetical protein
MDTITNQKSLHQFPAQLAKSDHIYFTCVTNAVSGAMKKVMEGVPLLPPACAWQREKLTI